MITKKALLKLKKAELATLKAQLAAMNKTATEDEESETECCKHGVPEWNECPECKDED